MWIECRCGQVVSPKIYPGMEGRELVVKCPEGHLIYFLAEGKYRPPHKQLKPEPELVEKRIEAELRRPSLSPEREAWQEDYHSRHPRRSAPKARTSLRD